MSETPNRPECGISEETIECLVLGLLDDEDALRHMQTCPICSKRIAQAAECVEFITGLRII